MFRKLITRVAIVCGVLVCVATAGAGITAYLALSVPSFYAELREQGVSSESEQAELQQLASEFERWAAVSVARRRAEHTNLENNRCSDTHTIRLTQYQLNAELASGRSGAGDLGEVRVQLLEDRIRLGAELFVQSSKMILTATLTPAIGEDGNLQLTIDRIGIGRDGQVAETEADYSADGEAFAVLHVAALFRQAAGRCGRRWVGVVQPVLSAGH